MNNSPVEIIVAAFSSPERAGQVMTDLKEGRKEGLNGIVDAAVVVKGADGKLKITDSRRHATRGFITGGVIGGVLGLLITAPIAGVAIPVGAVALGGGALGGLIDKLRSTPLKAEMKNVGSALPPNSSAIVAIIEHTWVSRLEDLLAAEGAKIVEDAIAADIAEQLNAGGNVIYAAAGSTGAGVERSAETRKGTRTSGPSAGDDGAFVTDCQITDEEPVEEPLVHH
jgi:uncharacterized membrane protein